MTTSVTTLLSRAATQLIDAGNVAWSPLELLEWVNAAQREIVTFKPAANAVIGSVLLTPGSTRHALPAGTVALIDVPRNLGAAGTTPGRAIRITTERDLSAVEPDWATAAADNTVGIRHYMYDPLTPLIFHTYPKAPATPWYVEVRRGALPAECLLTGDLQLGDEYANAVLDYVLYRAFSKDAEATAYVAAAAAYYQQFLTQIGAKTQSEGANDPNGKK